MAARKKGRRETQTEHESVRRIINILKICPIENLYRMQDLVLALVKEDQIVDGQAKRELKTEGQTCRFQKNVYRSLMKRLELISSAKKKVISRFLGGGDGEYGAAIEKLEKQNPDEETRRWLDKKQPNLNLLLGTCMDLEELFSCNVTEEAYYFSSNGKPFWSELEDKVSAAVEKRLDRMEADEEGDSAELWVALKEIELRSLLFEPENFQGMQRWYDAWIMIQEKVNRTGGEYAPEEHLSQYLNQGALARIDLIREVLENWEDIMQMREEIWQLWEAAKRAPELDRAGDEATKRMAEIQQSIREKGVAGTELKEMLQKAEEATKKLEEETNRMMEKFGSVFVEEAIKEWIPDYREAEKKIAENKVYEPCFPQIMKKKQEYEQKGKVFLQGILQYWPMMEQEKASKLNEELSLALRDYALQEEKLAEKLISVQRKSGDPAKKEETLLEKAPFTFVNKEALQTKNVKKEIRPKAAEWVASKTEDSLCFYLGWIYEQLMESMREHLLEYLEEVIQECE